MGITVITSGRKPYKELTFTDDYMFCRILGNDMELCRQLLEVILDKEIRKVELVDSQHTVSISSDIRSVRFDVYLNDDDGTVFDLEMQALRKPEMPKRSRYYQSITDIDHLGAGMSYGSLPDMYVIFICTFDPFYKGLPRYEFRNLCIEEPDLELGDGTRKVFINARSESRDISPELRALLDYLCGMEPSSELTRYISASIERAKSNRGWERDYVTFEEKLKEAIEEGRAIGFRVGMEEGLEKGREEGLEKGREEGLEKGREEGLEKGREEGLEKGREEGLKRGREEGLEKGLVEGQEQILALNEYLIRQERYDELKRASEDPEFRASIMREMAE